MILGIIVLILKLTGGGERTAGVENPAITGCRGIAAIYRVGSKNIG